MRGLTVRRALAAGALLALSIGCDGTDAPPDGGAAPDAGPGALAVTLEGPGHAFPDVEVCFAARATPPADRYTWTWGGGETEETTTPEACHAFPFVGPRVVGVTAHAGDERADATRTVTVVFEPSDPRPTHASPIVVRGADVWVVNPDADTVARLAADPPALRAEIAVGERPRALAVTDGVVAVACQGDATLHLLDASDGAPRETVALPAGSEPWSVVADPRGGGFFVALRAGAIVSVAPDGAVRDGVAVGPEPRGLAMNAEGTLLATRWRSTDEAAFVTTIDARDPATLALVGETALPTQRGLNSDTDNDGVLSFLGRAVPSPDGRRALLPALKANTATGLFRTGEPLESQTTARAALGEVTFGAPDAPATDSFRHSFDDLAYASALAFSPLGDRIYVAMQGTGSVVIADAFDFFTVASIGAVGEAPQGLALSADGETLYVQAFLSRSVRAYDVSDRSSEPPLVAEVRTVAEEPLAPRVLEGKRIFYRSGDPRMSRTGYLACASCHLDGEGDALVWDFTQRGEGLRNTISLRGRAGVAPLHWSANFDEVQDFEHDIRAGQGGTGFLDDAVFEADDRDRPLGAPKAGLSAELDALAAYVASLDDVGDAPAVDADAAARGRAIFEDPSVGCATCHRGPTLSDSRFEGDGTPRLHDVGTLGAGSGTRLGEPLTGLDTPSLTGLWRSAPYLHDGSAPTLRDVLTTRNPDDRHGVTSGLTEAQLDDLVAYLRSLD
ncbi:MAG TPA: c-type cytochrome [Sandaracinaceae bacterium LLY-WYZ-13_1]|nr:c-type cytochrome [Sandaracinaceae bacterium LLY-WYZ-13_1]